MHTYVKSHDFWEFQHLALLVKFFSFLSIHFYTEFVVYCMPHFKNLIIGLMSVLLLSS